MIGYTYSMKRGKIVSIGIAAAVVLLCIIIALYYSLSRQQEEEPLSEDSVVPLNQITITESVKVSPSPALGEFESVEEYEAHLEFVEQVDEHYDESFSESYPIEEATMALVLKEPSEEYLLIEQLTGPVEGSKLSFNQELYAVLENDALNVYEIASEEVVQSYTLEEETTESTFVWLNDELLMFVEKNPNDDVAQDDIYTLELRSDDKYLVSDSFMSYSGFDLSVEPIVYNNGSYVWFEDLDGERWQLAIVYR